MYGGVQQLNNNQMKHWTLGKLLEELELLEDKDVVTQEIQTFSYRGTPSNLGIQLTGKTCNVKEAISVLWNSMQEPLEAYRGGMYQMDTITPVWITTGESDYGLKLIGILVIDGIVNYLTK